MKVRNKKQLAMLVGMALSVTIGVGMNPGDAYAETKVTWDETKGYVVTYTDSSEAKTLTSDNAAGAIQNIITAMSTDASGGTINLYDLGDKGTELLDAVKSTDEFKIKNGAWYNLTDKNGTYGVGASDSATATVTKTGDKEFTVSGTASGISVNSANETTVIVAKDANGGKVTAGGGGKVNILKASGTSGTDGISGIQPWGDATIATDLDSIGWVYVEKSGTTLTLDASSHAISAGDVTGAGNIKVTGNEGVTVSKIDQGTTGTVTVDSGSTLKSTWNVTAKAITGAGTLDAGDNAINVGTGDDNTITIGTITGGIITAKSINATTVNAKSIADGTAVEADTVALGQNTIIGDSSASYKVSTLKTTTGSLTISDAKKLDGVTTLEAKTDLSVTGNVSSVTTLKSGGTLTIADGTTVNNSAAIEATTVVKNQTSSALEVGSIKTAALDAGSQAVVANNVKVNGAVTQLADSGITADSVTIGKGATFEDTGAVINTDNLTVEANDATVTHLENLTIKPKTEGNTVKVTVVTNNTNAVNTALTDKLKTMLGNDVVINVTNKAATEAGEAAEEAAEAVTKALNSNLNEFAGQDADEIAKADPFVTKLPSSTDVAKIASVTNADVANALTSEDTADKLKDNLNTAKEALKNQISNLSGDDYAAQRAELQAKYNEYDALYNSLDAAGMQKQAAALTAAVQQAGKTAAAPAVSSLRAAAVINDIMTGNVINRTSELREAAAAIDDGRPAPDNVWFQYKHTNTEVGGGDVYSKSTVNTNNYQLGYDAKVNEYYYLGAYIGTTTGSVEFTGPARSGDADIDSSFEFGIYGTHLLPGNQYIDYVLHTGKFDTKYSGEKWGTTDTGIMLGYGTKIAANERLTWNPYIRLSYDDVSVDNYQAGPNTVSSDSSNNWTAKIGINLVDASGFYGGLAYSRGLSGSYNAYINGIAMPTEKYNANVIYLNLGYRAAMSKNVFLDVSAEKTFADYKGWTATGKVNFYF